jgi:hypothetical protein
VCIVVVSCLKVQGHLINLHFQKDNNIDLDLTEKLSLDMVTFNISRIDFELHKPNLVDVLYIPNYSHKSTVQDRSCR